MLVRSLVLVGWMGLASLFVNVATAEDAAAPTPYAVDGVSFSDPDAEYYATRFRVDAGDQFGSRFSRLSQSNGLSAPNSDTMRQVEIALSAPAAAGLDVSFAHRAGLGVNAEGDVERETRGSELRLGRGLANMRRREAPSWNQPSWYFFAASDDEALTWAPGARNTFGGASSGWALQDRVEVGDMQAGITYEAGGLQASLAYVERKVSVRAGSRSISQDEAFTGLTITMRHQ
ncbi:MAG: hypothetical protein NW206_13555 [Hyphomonadaceae bacterium]|nr:hypothetical protein [Hyphomonadaceae bacterium]